MWKMLALVACSASVIAVPVALADEGNTTRTRTQPGCTPLKQIYSEGNWRQADPLRDAVACPPRTGAGVKNTIRHFREYRTYRQIATMRCLPGREGYYVPNPGSCSTIACESGYSWGAVNPSSGADGAYQLLDHGEPWPIHGFHDRLVHHEIAASLGRESWVC